MQVYGPGSTQHVQGTSAASGPGSARRSAPAAEGSPSQPVDRVEFSPAAQEAARLAEAASASSTGATPPSSDVRTDLVNRLRSEIAAGTYETPERLDGALDRLLNQLG
jgi:negative regulator of flagellin synthesis FlgM